MSWNKLLSDIRNIEHGEKYRDIVALMKQRRSYASDISDLEAKILAVGESGDLLDAASASLVRTLNDNIYEEKVGQPVGIIHSKLHGEIRTMETQIHLKQDAIREIDQQLKDIYIPKIQHLIDDAEKRLGII